MIKNEEDKKRLLKLHPIDSFGIQKVSLSGIRVERLEDRIRPNIPFPHKHDFFLIMIVTGGSGHHQIDFKNHKISPGQIYIMKPGQMHSWILSKGIKGYIVEFNYQSTSSIKESLGLINDLSFSPDLFSFEDKKNWNEIENLIKLMLEESNLKREMHDLCLQAYLSSFLINIIRLYQGHLRQAKTLTTIEKFRKLLEKNFKQAHTVDFYAHRLSISPKAFTMQLSRAIGRPPREIIQERILLEAKRYLAFSDLSIAEIGYELGFDDANYFTRFFRVHEGKTPAQFRREAASP
jgi:AraC family transcriptional activator of pobA